MHSPRGKKKNSYYCFFLNEKNGRQKHRVFSQRKGVAGGGEAPSLLGSLKTAGVGKVGKLL